MVDFISANGLRFAYLAEGDGPLALLLHGFPDTAHTWDDVRPKIAAAGYRAVSPFLRGYHPTEVPAEDTDDLTLGRDVLALIEAFGESSAVVIGHDWGASAAYTAASLAPERVRKLITVAIPHPLGIRPSLKLAWGARHFVAYKLPGAARRFAADDFAALPAIYKRWSPAWTPPASEFDAIRECFGHRESLDAAFGYYRKLAPPGPHLRKKLPMPSVAFAGLDDDMLTPDDFERARRMYSGDYVVETTRGGHFLHRESPDAFARRLLSHL